MKNLASGAEWTDKWSTFFTLDNDLRAQISTFPYPTVWIEGIMVWSMGGFVTIEDARNAALEYGGKTGAAKFAKILRERMATRVKEKKEISVELRRLKAISKKVTYILRTT